MSSGAGVSRSGFGFRGLRLEVFGLSAAHEYASQTLNSHLVSAPVRVPVPPPKGQDTGLKKLNDCQEGQVRVWWMWGVNLKQMTADRLWQE